MFFHGRFSVSNLTYNLSRGLKKVQLAYNKWTLEEKQCLGLREAVRVQQELWPIKRCVY